MDMGRHESLNSHVHIVTHAVSLASTVRARRRHFSKAC